MHRFATSACTRRPIAKTQKLWMGKICGFLFFLLSSVSAFSADANHYYDALGRLIETVGSDGSSVQFSYDAVGNVTSVRRKAANSLAISGFVPTTGEPGAVVTVFGSGFETVAANNILKLNGTTTTVSSATPTSLSFTVPSGATTGPIQLSNINGTATSQGQFVVAANKGPRITSFAPTVALQGTPLSIAGTNFQAGIGSKVTFGRAIAAVSSATSTNISTAVPAGVRSGKLTVTTSYGSTNSAADFFAVPTGSTTAEVVHTLRMVRDGASSAVSLPAGKKALLIFEGNLGQYMSIGGSAVTTAPAARTVTLSLYRPNGSQVATGPVSETGGALRINTPLTSETYTLLAAGPTDASSSFTVTVSSDLIGTLPVDGTSVAFSTARPGQRGRYTFTATAGQHLSLTPTGSTFSGGGTVTIYKPDGNSLWATSVWPLTDLLPA